MDLHTAGHRRGVACAPHFSAVEAGRAVLADGGNALEAMVAMAAAIAVVYPHMNHLGGDGFWLVREPSGRVRALMAAGRAGARATPQLYRDAGLDAIPGRGPLAALTVPGAIGGWMLALEMAKAQGGKAPLEILLAAAIKLAREGSPVTRGQTAGAANPELKDVPGFAQTFLLDGKPPQVGTVLRQPALAATLDQLVQAGLDDFYRGDVGREIAADLDRVGSPVTRADLERHTATIADALALPLQSGTVYNTPPPTQGLASLVILGIFERLRVAEPEGFDYLHGLIEATKRAFHLRDRYVTDPERLPHPPERYLAPDFLDAEAKRIDRNKAAPWGSGADADTIWMGTADASGLVVSYIQSLYWEYGSGVVLPRTGVLMQNRGTSFSLKRNAVNPLEPGRLPFHTLNPGLAVLKDGRVMAYGTRGGDGQPQTLAAVYTRHVLYRQSLPEAIDRPRWVLGRTWGSERDDLRLEPRFDGNVIDRLVSAGHALELLPEPYSGTVGHAGAALLHPDRTLEAAHDPRGDGGAAGV